MGNRILLAIKISQKFLTYFQQIADIQECQKILCLFLLKGGTMKFYWNNLTGVFQGISAVMFAEIFLSYFFQGFRDLYAILFITIIGVIFILLSTTQKQSETN